MTVVINKLFQPLSYQTSSGAGLHLPPRGQIELADKQVSEEMRRAAQRGFIVLQASEDTSKANGKSAVKKEG
ncbi:MAG: hypothetical protein WCJ56_12920 [bacterium]